MHTLNFYKNGLKKLDLKAFRKTTVSLSIVLPSDMALKKNGTFCPDNTPKRPIQTPKTSFNMACLVPENLGS